MRFSPGWDEACDNKAEKVVEQGLSLSKSEADLPIYAFVTLVGLIPACANVVRKDKTGDQRVHSKKVAH